ncbi:MAG: SDR family oxidoreductase [Candidatus Kryptoniota bacterium]
MDLGLKGKVAIVAASTKGLGRAAALSLAGEGANVVICGRHKANLSEAAEEIESRTGKIPLSIQADVTKSVDIDRLFNQTLKHFSTIHILVTNAGGPPTGYFMDFNDEQWLNAVELNLMSTVRLIRSAIPTMLQNNWGRIVNITSLAVKQPIENLVLSNSVRAAVVGLAKTISRDYAKNNILINNVAPGMIMTRRIESMLEERAVNDLITKEKALELMVKEIPMGRLGRPEEVGDLIAFLCSEKNTYITGATIQIDGGMYRGMF